MASSLSSLEALLRMVFMDDRRSERWQESRLWSLQALGMDMLQTDADIRRAAGIEADRAWYDNIPFSRVVFHLPTAPSVPAPLLPCAAERGMKMFAADPDWDAVS